VDHTKNSCILRFADGGVIGNDDGTAVEQAGWVRFGFVAGSASDGFDEE
jgi:hypothetical protein